MNVSRSEDAVDECRGGQAVMRSEDDISLLEVQLVPQDVRRGLVTDCEEESLDLEIRGLPRLYVLNPNALDLRVSENVDDLGVPEDFDIGRLDAAVLHDLAHPEFVPAMAAGYDLARLRE